MICLHRILLSAVVIFAFVSSKALASVLAIDYGTEWIKASLMKPGLPFDVLLNKDSKRKIQASVGWKRDDRLFGSDAFNLAARFPSDSFSSLKYLQGVPFDSNSVAYYTSISTADVVKTTRGTAGVRRPDGTEWSAEELIAMQFAYVKELAEAAAGEKVQDVVVTVPPFYTQFEKDAVVDAIEIAGLRTIALINDGTATAVNYAMTRTFPTPEHHIIYDAGASSIRATVVSFGTAASDSKLSTTKDATQITVLGVGYDRLTGGTELDRRLRDMMVADFQRKHQRDITGDKRGMAKLWKEAQRVKTVLSANAEAMATIESVAFDIDYRSKFTRAAFEEACSDLFSHFAAPIFEALQRSGLDLSNITSIIMTGGSSRVPMLQNAVKAAVGESMLAWNVNADEATVLGAALHGASLSRQFKTKDIRVSDISPYDVQISYTAEAKSAIAKPRTIHTLVFPGGSKLGTRKTLTFKRKEDLTLRLEYKRVPATGFPTELLDVDITGISEAIHNLTEMGAIDPVVKVTAALSESGFVSIPEAVAYGEVKDDSITGKLKGLFGGGASSEQVPLNADGTASTGDAEPAGTSSESSEPASQSEKPKRTGPQTIELKVKPRFPSLAPMSAAEKRKARDRLAEVDYDEKAKQRKEEARNMLESYLYRLRDLLEDRDNENSPFVKCSQESERRALEQKLRDAFAWLQEKADEAETSQLIGKRNELEALERPIVHRYKEIEEFPRALNNSQMWNWSTRLFLTDAKQNLTAEEKGGPPSKYTREELEELENALKEHEKWLNEKVEKQKTVKMNEDPAVESSELRARAKKLEDHLQRLVRRKVPLKKKTTSSSSASGTEGTTSASTASSASETPPRPSDSGHDEL
ncbi:actin-like ATPase domain-containing protein [Gloeophyllum trabeum ATCC 11539]|uniref:Actin-like ATPase domain-containing protein n=1 Tax=Gloeophyllum trabeum (strain ATCC 11539 / FP-39264 / Madison 617) TaxID=670483 RepID=S7Q8K8_GLOTA|nr:actin-like ATPase domain-containing protein [Gloeophyllum trabeum ATCC 11539]EPQ55862.1 actin-like ATPase domain-containing protein [Gloeophyllum trabeum ATCC 11539]